METPERGLLVSCLPDTGCTQSIISAELAKRLGATIDNKATIQLLTANGGSISVLGQARLYIQLKDKTTVTYAIVASGVSHPALISWHDLKYLGVISSAFPSASCSAVSPAKLRDTVLQSFPSVYRDEITETPMVGDPVKIHLKENAVPVVLQTPAVPAGKSVCHCSPVGLFWPTYGPRGPGLIRLWGP